MKYKMSDVAKKAGVSVATVSNVLNNKSIVSEETKLKVLSAVQEMGYSFDAGARMLKTGKSYAVGFIIPDISSAFYAILIKQIEEIFDKTEYTLIIGNTLEKPERQKRELLSMATNNVDGLIIASCCREYSEFQKYIPGNTPVLCIDRNVVGSPHSEISVNFRDALYRATEDLLKRGYRKFGIINGLQNWILGSSRAEPIIECLNYFNITVPKENIVFIEDINLGAGTAAVTLYQHGCDVIFAPNLNCANEAVNALLEAGATLNKDVTLLMIQDDPKDRDHYGKLFPMIVQPAYEIGYQIGTQILQMIEHPDMPPTITKLQAEYRPVTDIYYMKKWKD